LKDQQKAIDALQKSMKDLDKAMQDDLAKSQENYRQSVGDMARAAKDKIEQIDKDIEDEKKSRNQGWRTKVAELEKQKAEQQNIINRAGNEIGDIQNEVNKDDLTLLAEKHAKEMAAIKQQASDKKAEMQKEVDERNAFASGLWAKIGEKGFADKAISESMSFLGSIGSGPIQQSFIFNLPGVVAGDEGVRNIIMQAIAELNRQATLRNVGGK
jgi:phage host-nuclease inhibitor protein Gam